MSVYSNSNPLRYTVITFNEELDVSFTLKGAGGGGGGHPDDITKDYKGGDGSAGSEVTGTVRVKAGDTWTVFVGGGGRRGLSWYLGGDGGLGGPAKAGYNGGAGGRMGALGRSSGGGGGGGASVLSINGIDKAIASGGGGGGGEGRFSSGNDGTSHASGTSTYGEPGLGSNTDDGGGGGGGGGGTIGGRGGSFGSGDTGGHGGHRGSSSVAITGVTAISVGFGGAGGTGGSGDFTNNTGGADGSFVINSVTLPTSRYTGIYTKDAGTWKQPVPSVKYNGSWTQIQEGYVKNNDKWVRVYPPKVSVEINDYGVNEFGFGSPVQWNETINLIKPDNPPSPPDTTPDSFVIQSQFGKSRDTDVISESITITGLSTSVSITATNGITVDVGNTGTYSSSSTINNGQSFKAKVRSSASYGTAKTGSVTVGDYNTTWLVTTENEPVVPPPPPPPPPPDDPPPPPPPPPPDTTPNAFSFVSQIDLPLNSLRTSNTVTITGINVPVTATPSAGLSLSKNGGAYTTAPTTVVNGDTITLQSTSSTSYGRSATFELAVGQYSATWLLSTVGGVAPTAVNTSWQGAFNSINRNIHLPLTVNSVTSSPITAVTIVSQPKFGTVTIDGTTATYTPNTNASTPGSLSDGQAQTYVDYWTDLFPNGIKSTILAKSHWTTTGQGEGRFIPQIFTGADSFTWRVSNQYGGSNIASCVLTFSAPPTAPLDNDPPTIVSTFPTGSNRSTATGISFEYSDQVFPGTGSITVTGTDGSSISFTNNSAVPSGRNVSFQPGKLKSSTTYTVTVPSGYAKDIAGNPSGSATWSFTTADEEGPYVTNIAYQNGRILVTWNEPVTINSGYVEVIGPYYTNGDIESITHSMIAGPAPDVTAIPHTLWRTKNYWSNRNYWFDIDSDCVRDYSGNPNEMSNHSFYSDYWSEGTNVKVVPVVTTPVVVTPTLQDDPLELGGLGTTFYSGVTNFDFSALATAIDMGQITVVRVDSVTPNLSMTGGTVGVSTVDNNIELTVPNVTSIDTLSSTPTNIVGTIDTATSGLLNLTVQPSTFGGVDVTCTSTVVGQVSTVPLNIDLTIETASGFTATATCPVTVDLSNQIDQSMSSSAITYGGYSGSNNGWKSNTYDDADWFSDWQ